MDGFCFCREPNNKIFRTILTAQIKQKQITRKISRDVVRTGITTRENLRYSRRMKNLQEIQVHTSHDSVDTPAEMSLLFGEK